MPSTTDHANRQTTTNDLTENLAGARRTRATRSTRTGPPGTGTRAAIAVLAASAGLLAPVGLAAAQSGPAAPPIQIDQPQVQVLMPQRFIGSREIAQPVMVRTVDARVEIRGRLATTTLTMELANHSSRPAEAVLLLPVPEGASISAFGLNNGELKGEVLPIDEARRIYTEIVRRMVDPGLLEFVGTNAVRSSVFPVPAQGTQTATLTYTHVLDGHGGRVDYELPRSEDPTASQAAWTIEVSVNPIAIAGTPEGHTPAYAAWSPSHEIVSASEGADGSIGVRVRNAAQPGVFRLSILDANGVMPLTAMHFPDPDSGPDAGRNGQASGGHVAFFLAAPPADRATNPIPREVTVVIDRSGSMRGEKMEQAKAAALQVIEALGPNERFNVIDYSDDVRQFSAVSVEKNAENIARVRAYISGMEAVGGTNIHDALLEAVRPGPAEGTLPIVLFLTDGLATTGVTGEAQIRDAVAGANDHDKRIYTFGVGSDLNAALLATVATATRGTPTYVRPGESTEVKVGELFAKLRGPVLTSITLDGAGRLADALPGTDALPDLFAGSSQVVLARYTGDAPFTATLRGTGANGEPVEYAVAIDPKGDASSSAIAVPRLWAQRRVAGLIERIRAAGADGPINPDDPAIREMIGDIVHLSRRYGILTEYTAFLAAEREELALVPEFQDELGAFDAPASAEAAAAGLIMERAAGGRVGAAAVRQSENLQGQQVMTNTMSADDARANTRGLYAMEPGASPSERADIEQKAGRILSRVQQVNDQTLFNRNGRWVDARLIGDAMDESAETPAPDETVAFGTERYEEILTTLVSQNRQSMLAVRGEVELLLDGKRVLIQNPG